MNSEALLRVADLLERSKPVHVQSGPAATDVAFDMSSWGDVNIDDDDFGPETTIKDVCGTSACAAGHAALDPWFQERGLRLVALDPRKPNGEADIRIKDSEHLIETALSFARRGHGLAFTILFEENKTTAMDAVADFFEINDAQASFLFGGALRSTPEGVAKAIRDFVAQPVYEDEASPAQARSCIPETT